jgi:predicted nuclease of predicted toxin-antitoxin system
MKILIDMNLSLAWVSVLKEAGHTASHWSTIGSLNAPDDVEEQILCVTRRDILCPDLDDAWSFGFSGSEDCPKVEVMGKQQMPVRLSP